MLLIMLIASIGIPAMLLSWTNLGSTEIDGIQGRYFLPVVPLFLILLTKRTETKTDNRSTEGQQSPASLWGWFYLVSVIGIRFHDIYLSATHLTLRYFASLQVVDGGSRILNSQFSILNLINARCFIGSREIHLSQVRKGERLVANSQGCTADCQRQRLSRHGDSVAVRRLKGQIGIVSCLHGQRPRHHYQNK